MIKNQWVGPFKMKDLLSDVVVGELPALPEKGGAYVVTQKKWQGNPTKASAPLYVGSNTGKSDRFRTRVGDMVADTFGFFGGGTGHHSGGKSLNGWCHENKFNPLNLYLGWIENCTCRRCLEIELYESLLPLLSRKRPPVCQDHS